MILLETPNRAGMLAELGRLAVGDSMTISFKDNCVFPREAYLAWARTAHLLWGPGNYRVSKPKASRRMIVTHTGGTAGFTDPKPSNPPGAFL